MNSFISRKGGKKLLRDEIIARFPKDIKRYIEVFGGAGWVLFRKDKHAAEEIFNDADGGLVNLFRCVKYHSPELERLLAGALNSREIFSEVKHLHAAQGLTDIQRATAFYMLLRMSFGADTKSFGCESATRFQTGLVDLKPYQERLQRVLVEHKDFEALIKHYDCEGVLFYCDPPYYEAESSYEHSFTPEDHARLRIALAGIKGRFVLSYNDHPYVRELYAGFQIEEVERQHNLSVRTRYREVLVRNY